MLLRDATTKAISLLCNVTGRCWWRVYHHAVLQLPQPPRPLRDWIVVYVLHRNSIYFLLSFWSDATKKIIFFSFLHAFRFISLTMIKITDTLMKKGLTRSLMWGHLAHLFLGVQFWLRLSHFCRSLARFEEEATTTRHSFISDPEKEEHEAALGSSSLERNLARCFCFGFPSIFPIFCLSFPTRLEAQTMEIHLLQYWCISPLEVPVVASNLSREFELYGEDWEGWEGSGVSQFSFREEALKRTWRVKMGRCRFFFELHLTLYGDRLLNGFVCQKKKPTFGTEMDFPMSLPSLLQAKARKKNFFWVAHRYLLRDYVHY